MKLSKIDQKLSKVVQDESLDSSSEVNDGAPYMGPKGGPLGNQKKGPKKVDHVHWWTITEFIDGNPLIFIDGNPLIFIDGVHQWISMDIQFFEIQFFEKTMKKQWKNIEKQWQTRKNHENLSFQVH